MNRSHFVGQSNWTRSLRDKIQHVAPFSSNVLITGPSGTGKELIARAIHEHSPRAAEPFVPVDCTSLSGELFASHLFGHVKGAFTGADSPRLGCFRVADRGTLLLDEIGELTLDLQSRLLRVIQERVVTPLGSDQMIPVQVRIIAATNRDLLSDVQAKRFRLDLYYRLNVVSLETLALGDRPDDIEPLADYFLKQLAVERGFPRKHLSTEALQVLQSYSWPGNVRELQNALERSAIFSTGDEITAESLPREFAPAASPQPRLAGVTDAPSALGAWPDMAAVEREHIRATLAHALYNQSACAKLLHIDRASLARKIRRYGLALPAERRGRPRNIRSAPL